MLSLLPQILFLGAFAPLVIRLAVALSLAYSASMNIAKVSSLAKLFAVVEIVLTAAFFVGAWTQAAAIVAVGVLLVNLVYRPLRTLPRSTVLLLIVMTTTLIVTGPGVYAFDLPL
jgi:uncharacterized membrane protein YphA (DoxX/SURF4 family)